MQSMVNIHLKKILELNLLKEIVTKNFLLENSKIYQNLLSPTLRI